MQNSRSHHPQSQDRPDEAVKRLGEKTHQANQIAKATDSDRGRLQAYAAKRNLMISGFLEGGIFRQADDNPNWLSYSYEREHGILERLHSPRSRWRAVNFPVPRLQSLAAAMGRIWGQLQAGGSAPAAVQIIGIRKAIRDLDRHADLRAAERQFGNAMVSLCRGQKSAAIIELGIAVRAVERAADAALRGVPTPAQRHELLTALEAARNELCNGFLKTPTAVELFNVLEALPISNARLLPLIEQLQTVFHAARKQRLVKVAISELNRLQYMALNLKAASDRGGFARPSAKPFSGVAGKEVAL